MEDRKKIIPCVKGGIGNQLFIYAAARRLALVNNAELILDDVSGFVRDFKYKRHYQLGHFNISCRIATAAERLEPFSRVRRKLIREWNRWKPFERRTYLVQEGVDFDHRLLHIRPQGKLYLEGYWQSENYFKDVESVIRDDLRIKAPIDATNLAMAEKIKRQIAVAVHVRYFDQPDEKGVNNAPCDYYVRAVSAMEERVQNAHYFIFSDRPDTARGRMQLPEERMTLVHHNQGDKHAYADLWLMSQCQHFIIANSTFSWWGAWMSVKNDKIVIVPGFQKLDGKMSWGFRGLLPNSWIKL